MKLDQVLNVRDMTELARRRLPRMIFDLIDGGAEDEVTVRANESAVSQVEFRPRTLVDVSQRSVATSVVGIPVAASPVMKLNGHTRRAVSYLMGNHVVAEMMYGRDPGVMLYAPLRTLIYEELDGKVHFSIDQPSTRFSNFGNDDIAATGRRLDEKLAGLLAHLRVPVPGQLRHS